MMNWDDLRYVLALVKAGSLARAARALQVDHTTVGRRIEALEVDLGVRLFTRTTAGYVLTQEGETLLPEVHQIEAAVLALERGVDARGQRLTGAVRITAAETFGARWLAPRLAKLAAPHPELSIELMTGSNLFDLARREADVAVRFVRSKHEHLVVRRAGEMGFSLYATAEYLARRPGPPPSRPEDLAGHEILSTPLDRTAVEAVWIHRVARGAHLAFVSNLTLAVLEAVLAGTGIAVLPRFLGDVEPRLRRLPMPDEPRQAIWLTVHRDLQHVSRVRAVLDFLHGALQEDRARLLGEG